MITDKLRAVCMPLAEIPEFEEDLLRMIARGQKHTLTESIMKTGMIYIYDYSRQKCEFGVKEDKHGLGENMAQDVIDLLDAETQKLQSPVLSTSQFTRKPSTVLEDNKRAQAVVDVRAKPSIPKGPIKLQKVDIKYSHKEQDTGDNNENTSKQSRDTGAGGQWIEVNDSIHSKASCKRGMKQQSLMLHFQPLKFAKRSK
ncbi:hypothetical protein EON65_45775 [archaeon]|nr:MAG: hypothetical protein EON65_45775 [archaeon]